MRVTSQLLNSISLQGMQQCNNKMLTIVEQGNTGIWINRPSDDPTQYAFARDYDKQIALNEQYLSNITIAKGWLDRQSLSISNFTKSLTRIATLAEEAANGTTTDDQLNTIAYQLRNELNELISISNTQYNGNSIYAGTNFNTQAFQEGVTVDSNIPNISITGTPKQTLYLTTATGTNTTIPAATPITFVQHNQDGTTQDITLPAGATTLTLADGTQITFNDTTQPITENSTLTVRPAVYYMGSQIEDNNFSIEISENNTVVVNGTGDTIFGGINKNTNTATLPTEKNAFELVGKLIAAVEKHDKEEIQNLLKPLQESVKHITNYQANVGGKINYVDTTKKLVEESTAIAKNTRSDLQDVNITDLLAEAKNLEVQYSLAVTIYSKINAMNILQYI